MVEGLVSFLLCHARSVIKHNSVPMGGADLVFY